MLRRHCLKWTEDATGVMQIVVQQERDVVVRVKLQLVTGAEVQKGFAYWGSIALVGVQICLM